MVTQKDIAEALNVTTSIVSAALNDNYKSKNISRKRRVLIKETARKMGYVVDDMARAIKTGKAKIIAMANSDFEGIYSEKISIHLVSTLYAHGYSLLPLDMTGINRSPEKYDDIFENCVKNRVSALIVRGMSNEKSLKELKNKLEAQGIEFALLSNNAQINGCINVNSKDKEAMHDAVEYLYKFGHRDFLLITTDIYMEQHTCVRLAGFEEKAKALGVRHRIINAQREQLQDVLLEIFSKPGKHPTAVICNQDSNAILFHSFLSYECGLKCPRDYSLIGFGGEIARGLYPRLTVITEPHKQMADAVVEKIIAKIEGRDCGSLQTFFDDELVIGESTAPPPENINHQ